MKGIAQLALAILCALGMWLHVDRVLVGHQVAEAAAHGTPRGNLSDLYPVWLGSREVLLHGLDPYSETVTREIQVGYYGRPLDRGRIQDPTNAQAFAYPVYVALFLAPVIRFSFTTVRIVCFWLFASLAAISVVLWFRTIKWRPARRVVATAVILTLGSFAAVQGIKLQQLSLPVAFLIAASVALLVSYQLILSGILLALAMVKPQLTFLLAAWLLLWAASDWRRRWKFAVSFIAAFATMVICGEFLLPGWIAKFYAAIQAYRQYAASGPLLSQMVGPKVGDAIAIVILASVAAGCWRIRKSDAEDPGFLYITSLVLAVTLLALPMYPPHYQLLLLPGIFMLAKNWRGLWQSGLVFRILLGLVVLPLAWSWIAAIVIATGSFFTAQALNFWQVPLWSSIVEPIPVIACLALVAYRPVIHKFDTVNGH